MRPHPQETVLHELLQHGYFPRGAVFQEQTAPVWIPHGVRSPANNPVLEWGPPSTGSQVLPGACSSLSSPRNHSRHWASTCSGMESSRGGYLLLGGPPWAAGVSTCFTIVFTMGCRGMSSPSSLTFMSAELFLSHILTFLSTCKCCGTGCHC